jgi:hypothetical protein
MVDVVTVPFRVEVPATVRLPPTVAAPVTLQLLAVTPANVAGPATFSVPFIVVVPDVVKLVTFAVFAVTVDALTSVSVAVSNTFIVDFTVTGVLGPVTTAFPVIDTVFENVTGFANVVILVPVSYVNGRVTGPAEVGTTIVLVVFFFRFIIMTRINAASPNAPKMTARARAALLKSAIVCIAVKRTILESDR